MDSKIIQRTTQEQKDRVIDIPDFIKQPTTENEIDLAILNNVPGNQHIEEVNHLNELEEVCQNWKPEEWKRVMYHAPRDLMVAEINRRMGGYEEFREAMKGADEIMKRLKL